MLAVEVPTAARSLLVLQYDARRSGGLEKGDDVAGDLDVAVAVVDVDQEVRIGKHRPDALHERHHVRPGDEADVGHAVLDVCGVFVLAERTGRLVPPAGRASKPRD
jgi:hypothetical protein